MEEGRMTPEGSEKGDTGSEEWIMEDLPEATKR